MTSRPGRSLVRRHDLGDGVVELVLDRPEAANALSARLLDDLAETCRVVGDDEGVRVVVLASSASRAFSVGADLKERASATDEDLRRQRPRARAAYRAVMELPVPAVAAVHGYALGGGYELALACDLVVADETAVLGLPETSVGVVPGGGGMPLLLRRVGAARAADLVLTARRLPAQEALRLGLVDQVVQPGGARDAALGLAAAIAGNSPVAVRAAKAALRRCVGLDLASALEVEEAAWRTAAFSPDRVEGVQAFVEKRPPRWPSASGAR